MVRKMLSLFLTALVASLLLIKPSSSKPIQNDIMEELKSELNSLRSKVELLEVRNAENTEAIKVSQEVIAKTNAKAATIVHFYVQKNSVYSTADSVVPFEIEILNEGGAMDLATGRFTAPVPGIYHFEFSGITSSRSLSIHLQVNGAWIGRGYTDSGILGNYDTVSLSSSLRLKAGDRVDLYKLGNGELYDDGGHSTHFTGWLVEEGI